MTYGDAGDARVQSSIKTVLEVIANGMPNGRVVAKEAGDALNKMFESVRADIIAEFFTKEHNAGTLVSVARELDDRAHSIETAKIQLLSVEAKSVLGIFADFVQAKRAPLLNGSSLEALGKGMGAPAEKDADAADSSKEGSKSTQAKLL